MNRYELDKLNKEIERLTMENEALVDRIERLQERIANLEDTIKDNVYTQGYGDMYVVAKAVHECKMTQKIASRIFLIMYMHPIRWVVLDGYCR